MRIAYTLDSEGGAFFHLLNGTMDEARNIAGSRNHKIIKKNLGPMTVAAMLRPDDYAKLPGREQWDIDKKLCILDWDGDPEK